MSMKWRNICLLTVETSRWSMFSVKSWKKSLGKNSSVEVVILIRQSKRHSSVSHLNDVCLKIHSRLLEQVWTNLPKGLPSPPHYSSILFIYIQSQQLFYAFVDLITIQTENSSTQTSNYVLVLMAKQLSQPVHFPDTEIALVWQFPPKYSLSDFLSSYFRPEEL